MAAMAESRAPNVKVVITDSDNIEHDVSKEVSRCKVVEILNEGVDTFAFTLTNMKRYVGRFQEHDEVKIYQVDESNHETQILGGNIDSMIKQFPGMMIQFNGREYAWELAERLTEANKIYLDYEISDIVKDLLSVTSFNTYGVQFGSGAEVTRENFLYHGYPDENDILSKSNVTFNSANYPVDTDEWTEGNAADWGISPLTSGGFSLGEQIEITDEAVVVQEGSKSIEAEHLPIWVKDGFEDDSDGAQPAKWYNGGAPGNPVLVTNDQAHSGSLCVEFNEADPLWHDIRMVFSDTDIWPSKQGYVEWEWRVHVLPDSGTPLGLDMHMFGKVDKTEHTPNTMGVVKIGPSLMIMNDYNDPGNYKIFRYYEHFDPHYWTWEAIKSISVDTWYKCKIVYDCDTHLYDIYVDDVLEHANNVFPSSDCNYLDFFALGMHPGTGKGVEHGPAQGWADDIIWRDTSGNGNVNREFYYNKDEDLALDARGYILKHYIRQTDAGDTPQIRLYTSAGNYFYRSIPIYASNSFELKEFACGYGEGWSEEGTPDWANINYISFYYSASCIDISKTYIDELHFAAEGNFTLDKAADDPVDKELGTENESGQWGSSDTLTVGDSVDPKHTGTHATSLGDAAADSITDTNEVDFAGDFVNMVDPAANDKLEMLSGELITQTAFNGEELLGEGGNPLYHATKFKAKGTSVTTVGLRLRNDDNGARTYYWQLRATWGGANLDSGSFAVAGFFNSWKDVAVNYSGLTVGTWYFLRLAGADDRCFWKKQSTNVNADLIFVNSEGGDEAQDFTCTFDFTNEVGSYVSDEKDAGATNQWTTMDITSVLNGAVIKLYTDSNDDQDWGAPSWTLRATLVGGAEVDIDVSGEDGRYFKYKVDVESDATPTTEVDDIDMYYGTTGAGQIRYAYYPSAKNWAKDLSGVFKWNFWFYSDTTEDLEVRMYTSAGNYFYQVLPVDAADTWEQHIIALVRGTWDEEGSPDWTNINWLEFYITAAKTRTISYVDEQYFDAYETSGWIESIAFTTVSEGLTTELEYFNQVIFELTKTVAAGSSIDPYASNDERGSWNLCSEAAYTQLADRHSCLVHHGRILNYKLMFISDGSNGVTLNATAIHVKTIPLKILDYSAFNRESLLSAIAKLGDINGSDFFGDWSKNFHFFPAETKSSGVTFTEGKNIEAASFATDIKKLKNKIWLYGAKEAYVPRDMDAMTEDNADIWTTSNLVAFDDDTEFKQGGKSIRCAPNFGAGTQWNQEFEEGTDDLTLVATGDSTITRDADENLVKIDSADKYGTALMYLENDFAAATTAYDISFDFDMTRSTSKGDFCLVCAFVGAPPVRASNYTSNSFDALIYADPINKKFVYYHHTDGATDLLSDLELPLAANFRLVRAGDKSVKIYIDGILVTSKTPDDHVNIQFGECRTAEGSRQCQTYDDLAVLVGAAGANSCNLYTDNTTYFPLNLNRYKTLDLFIKVNSMGKIEIRLEDDSNNYFSWSLYINKAGKWQLVSLPVGSDSSGWTTTGSVSWDEINQIRFIIDDTNKLITSFKIDALHFKGRPIIILAEDSTSQTAYGVREKVIIDESIQRVDFGKEIASSVLSKYKDPLTRGTISTTDLRLVEQGRTVTVTISSLEISGTYKIVKCTHSYSASGVNKSYSLDNDFIYIEDILHSIMTELDKNAQQQIEQLREVEV